MRQYDCGLKRWWRFCKEKGLPVFEADITSVIEFLTNLFEQGLAYGSLNSYRSSLSLIINPQIGLDYRIKRFFRSVAHLRPGRPKYDLTWDPTIVLEYVATLFPNEELSFDLLSRKVATLLALVTAHRVQTLALIDIRDIELKVGGIRIKVPARIKTTGKDNFQLVLELPYFKDNPRICPARALQTYLLKSKDLRNPTVFSLFLTHKKPHSKASSQTISRWIKEMLSKSGIDTSIFTAHSTKHASTSAASRKGITLDTIRRTAGWARNSATFARFYNRPTVEHEQFADTFNMPVQ